MLRRMLLVTSVAIASMSALASAQPVPNTGGGNGNAQPGGGGGGPGGGGGGPGGGGRGNFDPAQMRQRMMDMMKQQLGASDDEWAVLQPKVEAVMNAQRDARAGGGGGFGGFGGRGGGGPNGGGGGGGGGRNGGGQQDPNAQQSDLAKAATALNDSLQNQNASSDDITTKLKAYRDARTAAEDKLKAAREDLKGVTNARQEAMLVLRGLLE